MHGERLYCGDWVELRRAGGIEFASRLRGGNRIVEILASHEEHTLLIEQFRPVINKTIIELPAGCCGDEDPVETLEQAARRELLEETGYHARSLIHVAAGPASSGMTDEIAHFFLAFDVNKVDDGGGVDNEKIVVHRIKDQELNKWLSEKSKAGIMISHRVFAALYLRSIYQSDKGVSLGFSHHYSV